MKPVCTKCKGDGLIDREGIDPVVHPFLSKAQTTCDHCGGGGEEPPAKAHEANQLAASASDS